MLEPFIYKHYKGFKCIINTIGKTKITRKNSVKH